MCGTRELFFAFRKINNLPNYLFISKQKEQPECALNDMNRLNSTVAVNCIFALFELISLFHL